MVVTGGGDMVRVVVGGLEQKSYQTYFELSCSKSCAEAVSYGCDNSVSYFSDIKAASKPPPGPPRGLLANPQFSSVMKNSLFSQVNTSIITAGVQG